MVILEDKNPSSSVGQVTASDPDDGVNGEVTYSITGGNDDGMYKRCFKHNALILCVISSFRTSATLFLHYRAVWDQYYNISWAIAASNGSKGTNKQLPIIVMFK